MNELKKYTDTLLVAFGKAYTIIIIVIVFGGFMLTVYSTNQAINSETSPEEKTRIDTGATARVVKYNEDDISSIQELIRISTDTNPDSTLVDNIPFTRD